MILEKYIKSFKNKNKLRLTSRGWRVVPHEAHNLEAPVQFRPRNKNFCLIKQKRFDVISPLLIIHCYSSPMKKILKVLCLKFLQMLEFLIHLNNEHSDQNLIGYFQGGFRGDICHQELVVSKLHSNFFHFQQFLFLFFDLIVV